MFIMINFTIVILLKGNSVEVVYFISVAHRKNGAVKSINCTLKVDGNTYENCLLVSGANAIYYKDNARNILGLFMFDKTLEKISLTIDDNTIIVAPAETREEATKVYKDLIEKS